MSEPKKPIPNSETEIMLNLFEQQLNVAHTNIGILSDYLDQQHRRDDILSKNLLLGYAASIHTSLEGLGDVLETLSPLYPQDSLVAKLNGPMQASLQRASTANNAIIKLAREENSTLGPRRKTYENCCILMGEMQQMLILVNTSRTAELLQQAKDAAQQQKEQEEKQRLAKEAQIPILSLRPAPNMLRRGPHLLPPENISENTGDTRDASAAPAAQIAEAVATEPDAAEPAKIEPAPKAVNSATRKKIPPPPQPMAPLPRSGY